ncbi:MAG TPA: YceI family protein [Polyangiaceae bacterium]|nr:YceI family protein [Polyangiaceae bacterium]
MRSSIFVLSLLALSACNNDPTKGKPQATVSSPLVTSTAAPAGGTPAPAGVTTQYAFSNEGSQLAFVGAKVTGKHDGSFKAFRGTISVVDNDPAKSTVTVEADSASLDTDTAKLTGHLKSPDFFDVEKYPKVKFNSTSIVKAGSGYTVTGNLDLHGVTKSISFPASLQVAGDTATADAEFGINRKDFNIVYAGKPDDLIKDEVLIKLKLVAKKQ